MLSGYWNDGAGCSIKVLAELMGDTPKVAFDHYGREWSQHYQDPLWAAVGLLLSAPRMKASLLRLAFLWSFGRRTAIVRHRRA
jgi:hypothetical protein